MDNARRAEAAVKKAQEEFETDGVPYTKTLKIGIMIEIPPIALIVRRGARSGLFKHRYQRPDAIYTCVDRMNPAVAEYYQSYHPALVHMI